jgi:SAM-dependent methyltransferase
MTEIFGDYSRYYDLLYKEKDYNGEANYVQSLFRQFAPHATTILNLGCGTAAHDVLLCRQGYTIDGVDMSDEMLRKANEKLSNIPALGSSLRFHQGDIRTVRLGKTFDAVISLFHVMSYQTTNDDLLAAMKTAKVHLKADGLFIFDCWYGPAVLTDRPVVRVKRLNDDTISVVRIAEPVLYPEKNLVDVCYTLIITDKKTGAVQELRETHTMRYLFSPEIEMIANDAGFKILAKEEWMTKRTLAFDTWNGLFVCQRVP